MRAIGYHGTSVHAALRILATGFESSRNDYDWLGDGAYFFQDAPHRAMEWARQRFGPDAAVVAAEIDLEDCIDLLDIQWHDGVRHAYGGFCAVYDSWSRPLPRQSTGAHRLDRGVLNYLVQLLVNQGEKVHAIRASFGEGEPLFPGSALLDRSHVQIAVREPKAILRVWQTG